MRECLRGRTPRGSSRVGLATTSGSGGAGGALAAALGASSLRSSSPSAGSGTPFNIIEFLSIAIGSHLRTPYCNSKGGVSVSAILAERAGPESSEYPIHYAHG